MDVQSRKICGLPNFGELTLPTISVQQNFNSINDDTGIKIWRQSLTALSVRSRLITYETSASDRRTEKEDHNQTIKIHK
jgi:hypothetical protein